MVWMHSRGPGQELRQQMPVGRLPPRAAATITCSMLDVLICCKFCKLCAGNRALGTHVEWA